MTRIVVDGVPRPMHNSKGRLIHPTEEGIRNFWRWFGQSRAVDAAGRPLVLYHGASQAFSRFDSAKTRFAEDKGAFFFTDCRGTAEAYAQESPAGVVMDVYLSVRALELDTQGGTAIEEWDSAASDIRNRADMNGHDGVIIRAADGEGLYVAFHAGQVKSASLNNGRFDPRNPAIDDMAPHAAMLVSEEGLAP